MKQLPLDWGRDGSRAVKPRTTIDGRSRSAARPEATTRAPFRVRLEDALERTNLQRALRRVEQNAGAPGVDGMTVDALRPWLKENWPRFARSLLDGSYVPSPVRRVEIAKPAGGMRPLGIPTAIDRFLQQALLQVLQPLFDREFSPHSYGFRPGRSAHQAVRAARAYIAAGYAVVVDTDLASFFDRVNHDVLMARLAKRIGDKRILRLIRRYLEAGVMTEGVKVRTEMGTPQGGLLSPLLANVLLDDLDRELQRRGHRFVRYADDCNIYVGSLRAGERVMAGLRHFLQRRLRLQVNEEKSAVDRANQRGFLGFRFLGGDEAKIRLDPESLRRVKAAIRRLTKRSDSIAMTERIRRLNTYLMGWMQYFALADTPSVFENLDKWLRRRLRQCRWKEWKGGPTRKRQLLKLGSSRWSASAGYSRKGSWRIAGSGILQQAMPPAYWVALGLRSLRGRYTEIRCA
jgi:RNA-directed DNA polymerase